MELDYLKRLEREATPGPWRIVRGHQTGKARGVSADHENVVNFRGISAKNGDHNAALIAAARNALPALIECARALEAFGEYEEPFYVWRARRAAALAALKEVSNG